ncbi:MerR family transcriptional regulator [Candidatus Bipolaricaulota bacterium]|nr:MerR family transcriptional regulator [Candidatus Bipolaricaulota bacterium]
MTIKDACMATGLTRKAIRYYESIGLISPDIDSNGYRNYSDEVVHQLAVIAILRGFRFSVEEIRECLADDDSLSLQVEKKILEFEEEQQRLDAELELLRAFAAGRRSLEETADLRRRVEDSFKDRPGTLRERLQQLFPGDFGEVVAAVYGSLLDQRLETSQQHAAWLSLVAELDEMPPIEVPDEISAWAHRRNDETQIAGYVTRMKKDYSQDYEAFSKQKRESAERYLNETSGEDMASSVEHATQVSAYLAGPGRPLMMTVGNYLPVLSTHMRSFAEKGQRFIADNPELLRRLTGS